MKNVEIQQNMYRNMYSMIDTESYYLRYFLCIVRYDSPFLEPKFVLRA